jgi:hypothetical protein
MHHCPETGAIPIQRKSFHQVFLRYSLPVYILENLSILLSGHLPDADFKYEGCLGFTAKNARIVHLATRIDTYGDDDTQRVR